MVEGWGHRDKRSDAVGTMRIRTQEHRFARSCGGLVGQRCPTLAAVRLRS